MASNSLSGIWQTEERNGIVTFLGFCSGLSFTITGGCLEGERGPFETGGFAVEGIKKSSIVAVGEDRFIDR